MARQLDAALLDVGFSASRELLEHLGALAPAPAMDLAATVVSRRCASWSATTSGTTPTSSASRTTCRTPSSSGPSGCGRPCSPAGARRPRRSCGTRSSRAGSNLLDLPGYGTYQHTYAELLAAHDDLIAAAGDRVTLLRLGDTADVEAERLYLALAGSATPLGEADLAILSELAVACVDGAQPAEIPVRENRAVLNGIRLVLGRPLVAVDTTTDVLRLACQVSGGDASLVTPTRFRAFRRPERRMLLAALNEVVGASPDKLGDVARYAERWKRLGERLHPHEYGQWPHAQEVFAVARGERRVRNLAGRAEAAIRAGAIGPAAAVLSAAPGLLLRSADRLLRLASAAERAAVVEAVTGALGSASGRVLCSLREHVGNRLAPASARMYASRSRTRVGRARPAAAAAGRAGGRAVGAARRRDRRPAAGARTGRCWWTRRCSTSRCRCPARRPRAASRCCRGARGRRCPVSCCGSSPTGARPAGAPTTTCRCCCSTTSSTARARCPGRTTTTTAWCTPATSPTRRTARPSSSTCP